MVCGSSVTHLGIGIKSICTVDAISESVVLCIPMTCLIKLTKENLDVARIYNKMLSISLKKVIEHNRILSDYEVRNAISGSWRHIRGFLNWSERKT